MQEKQLLNLILPDGVLQYFDVKESVRTEDDIHIILEEKNDPPIKKEDSGKNILSKGFTDITITDFPLRGRRTLITFRRRYWQIEGIKELLKRDIKLCFPGTQLEREFADFLKEDGGYSSGLTEFYRRVSKNPSERV
jgi:hypothetical protein